METYKCRDGREVDIDFDDDEEITVWTKGQPKQKIGWFHFQAIEGAERWDPTCYLVTNMHLEGPGNRKEYVRQGIGQAILKRLFEEGRIILFTPVSGLTNGFGSHLTGDGPAFAETMIRAGFAAWDD